MAGQSQILIDGVPTNGAYLNVVTVIPTQDAIEEFKVQTNNLGLNTGDLPAASSTSQRNQAQTPSMARHTSSSAIKC